jgi:hypothetical protein
MMMLSAIILLLQQRPGNILNTIQSHILHCLSDNVRSSHFILDCAISCGGIHQSIGDIFIRNENGILRPAKVAIVSLDGCVSPRRRGGLVLRSAEWVEVGIASIATRWCYGSGGIEISWFGA